MEMSFFFSFFFLSLFSLLLEFTIRNQKIFFLISIIIFFKKKILSNLFLTSIIHYKLRIFLKQIKKGGLIFLG
ncbi:expressed protein [Phakopsora pachyrhizi]|uniref:Expressed protein n=1 Tax=Phakopsora pachyrhizi TaxID=170000 RepID=A0AAV0AUF2_PHAPC|nr:expressed protein [Phakopsora pachyrhizi]